ncbi:copper resistance CopC family protein [Arthrobacter sp. TMN-50]
MSKFSPRAIAAPASIAALTLMMAGFLGTAPAQAHDSLVSTSPAEGETITEDRGTVSLTLTAEPQSSEGVTTSFIEVTAGDGHPSSSGEVTVDGATISTDVFLEHEDDYTVDWRTVSADGHPIEGSYTFTYSPEGESAAATPEAMPSAAEQTGAPAGDGAPTNGATAGEPAGADSTSGPGTVEAASASQDEGTATGMIITTAAVVVVLAATAAYFIGRRNSAKDI